MSDFEFTSVVVSILIAFAFSEVLVPSFLAAFMVFAGLSDRVVLGQDILPFWSYLVRAGVLLIPAFSRRVALHAAALALTVIAPLVLGAVHSARDA